MKKSSFSAMCPLDRCRQTGPVGLRLALREAIERHYRLDPVRSNRSEDQREHAAHAEPDCTDALAGHGVVVSEVVDRAAHVARRPLRREALHQLGRLFHLVVTSQLTVIEVRRQRHETSGTQPIGHLLDSGIQAPPFLNHYDARARTPRRPDQIAGCRTAIALELNSFCHGRGR